MNLLHRLVALAQRMPFLSGIHPHIYKGVISLFLLRGIQMGLGLLIMYVLSHTLSQHSFGEYHFILNVIGVLTIFTLTGLGDSVMQSVARGFRGTYRVSSPLAFYGSLIGGGILAIMGAWFIFKGNNELAAGLFAAAFLFPFAQGLTLWKSIITGSENFPRLLRLEGTNSAVASIMVIGGVVLLPGTLLVPLVAGMVVPSFQNIRQTFLSLRSIPKDAPIEAGSVAYGMKTTLYSSLNILSKHADKIFLFTFLSPQTLALYVAAEKMSETMRSMTQDIAGVLGPRFAQYSHYTKRLDKALKVFSGAMGAFIIIVAFTILPWVVITIFGEGYRNSIPYAQALMCSAAIGNLANLQFRFIRSQLDEKSFRMIMVYSSLARIASSAFLIPLMGMTGAVISVFIFRISTSIIVNAHLRKFRLDPLGAVKN